MSSVHLWAWPGNIWQFRLSLIIPSVKIVNTEYLPYLSLLSKKTHCILGRTMALLPSPSGLSIMTQDPTPFMYLASEFIENTWKVQVVGRNASDQSKNVISHQFWAKALISLTKSCIFQGSWRFNWSTDGTHLRIWNWWILEGCDFTYDKYIL